MAKRRERSEFSCIPGLFDISDSHKLVTKGMPPDHKLIIDYSRKIHHGSCFDEECQRIRMLSGRRFTHEDGARNESKLFSHALEDLGSDKFVEVLSDPEPKPTLVETVCKSSGKSNSRGSNGGRASFSVGKILKHTFGSSTREVQQFSSSSNTSVFGDERVYCGVDATKPMTNVWTRGKRQGMKLDTERKKIDVSSETFLSKNSTHEAVLAANRLVSDRLTDSCSRRDSQYCSGSEQVRLCSYNASHAANGRQMASLSPMRMYTRSAQYSKPNDKKEVVETDVVVRPNGSSNLGSTLYSTEDYPSTPTRMNQFNMGVSSKNQEEHESPVSVLDQFFALDIYNTSDFLLQNDEDILKPRRLIFEECSFDSYQEDTISQFVHVVLEASSLNWDKITRMPSPQLLHSSSYDVVEPLFSDSGFDTRLLFDSINEVLVKIQRSNSLSPTLNRRTIRSCAPLEVVVVDEIEREADMHLLHRTQPTTLDEAVARDMADCRMLVDVLVETENIMIQISEGILQEAIVDVMLQL